MIKEIEAPVSAFEPKAVFRQDGTELYVTDPDGVLAQLSGEACRR